MKQIKNTVLICFGFLLFSCKSHVEIPAYVYVESVDFIPADEQGTSSFKIPDVWVTVNGTGIGAYQLPALVPVIAEGSTDLIFEAGIKLNGRTEWRPKPSIFTYHKETVHLVKGKIDTISPVFYYNSVKFALKENFESGGMSFHSVNGGAKLKPTADASLLFHYKNEPNNYSGIIQLPDSNNVYFFEI
jgi:hypothetical protein